MSKTIFRIFLAIFFFILFFCFFYFRWYLYFRLSSLQLYQKELKDIYLQSPFLTMVGYFIIYILVTGFSLPGAIVLTVAGGFLFGLLKGTILASFASSVGALIAFLLARFLFNINSRGKIDDEKKYIEIKKENFVEQKWVQSLSLSGPLAKTIETRFGKQIKLILNKIQIEGAYYLFTLRLVPVVPFFIVNILMGLTPIRAYIFFGVSLLGMLPATLLYVNAGVQLSELETLKDIISIPFILSFTLLGLFPLVIKKSIKNKNKII
ncbi:MAG: VTT domain-containing protein [Bdellovibrionales bacterium]|nr:VTT domain-containing protein [Bdellovibrionales bacterium]